MKTIRPLFCLRFFLLAGQTLCAEPPSLSALMKRDLGGRELTLKKVLAENRYYTRYLINYKSGGLTISGIMNVPKGKGPFPVIITNHGFISPSVYTPGRGLKREQDYLARRGYIVVHPDYRSHGLSDKDPDELATFNLAYEEDVISCILAVKSSDKKYFDKERIGMLGHSRGGGIALNLLVARPDLVRACVLFAPISMDARDNFERWTLGKGRRRPRVDSSGHRQQAEKIMALYGSPETNPAFWEGLSARTYFNNIKAPIMLHHGTADDSVPIEWSDKLAEALKKEKKQVSYYRYPGERHEFGPAWPLVMQRTAAFFDAYLKLHK
jgi:dipeptidyl aminopeptidase/acylaminoacyl peptidase